MKDLKNMLASALLNIDTHSTFRIRDVKTDATIYKLQEDCEIYIEINTGVKHYYTDFETLQTTTDGSYEYIIDDFGDICIITSIECFEATVDKLLDLIKHIHNISQNFSTKINN